MPSACRRARNIGCNATAQLVQDRTSLSPLLWPLVASFEQTGCALYRNRGSSDNCRHTVAHIAFDNPFRQERNQDDAERQQNACQAEQERIADADETTEKAPGIQHAVH